MPQYKVSVCRTSYAFKDIPVHAESAEEAMRLAKQEAGNHVFSEKDAEYESQDVTLMPES